MEATMKGRQKGKSKRKKEMKKTELINHVEEASSVREANGFKGQHRKRMKAENFFRRLFFLSAMVALAAVVAITIFIFVSGVPAIAKIGVFDFVFGQKWKPSTDIYGIFPMIMGSLAATGGAILIGVPMGIFTAIFMAEIAPDFLSKLIRPAIELLAGIPSVVYGFWGLVVLVPLIDKVWGGGGNSLLAAIVILTIMILPTIVNVSEAALRAVPKAYGQGSLALGASKIETIFRVKLPAAKSGILAAVVLGIGRAIGETMAVILVAGNTPMIPGALTDRIRTMTANIAMEMGYAFGLHQEALFATGVILFVFIMALNLALNRITHQAGDES
jgi:phosphate transport system permease protein